MATIPKARYIGFGPRMRGLGLTGLVKDHPTRSGLLLVQLDDVGRWERQMLDDLGFEATGWVPYKRTSWKILPEVHVDWSSEEQQHG